MIQCPNFLDCEHRIWPLSLTLNALHMLGHEQCKITVQVLIRSEIKVKVAVQVYLVRRNMLTSISHFETCSTSTVLCPLSAPVPLECAHSHQITHMLLATVVMISESLSMYALSHEIARR